MADVKELVPEFYHCPDFLRNANDLPLGSMQSGIALGDVRLPLTLAPALTPTPTLTRTRTRTRTLALALALTLTLTRYGCRRGPALPKTLYVSTARRSRATTCPSTYTSGST